jgi:lysophospholipase L1-like esterase
MDLAAENYRVAAGAHFLSANRLNRLSHLALPACILNKMFDKTRRLFPKLFFELACALFLGASLHAATLAVHKVATFPTLSPLAMSTGGRMLTTPSVIANSFGAKDYTSQWPGSYFGAAFSGTSVFFRVVRGDEILHVVVDGQPDVSLVKPEAGVYEVEGLDNGEHRINVFVATESQAASDTFGGFAIPSGDKAIRPPQRHRQIEFIGDSHTVGYGDISTKRACTKDEVWADTDDTKAFGPITANHYDADYQINAISGRGVVRNYNGFKGDTLPQAYPYVLLDRNQNYEDAAWKPQVFVIALGTNDFSTPLNPWEPWKTRDELHADYEATYRQFLEKLRANNPTAYFIVWATDVANGEVETEGQKVVQQLKEQGDRHITFLPINGLSFSACNSHPSLADEKIISDKLVHLIDADQQVWHSQ